MKIYFLTYLGGLGYNDTIKTICFYWVGGYDFEGDDQKLNIWTLEVY